MRAAARTRGLSDTAFHWICGFQLREKSLLSGMRKPAMQSTRFARRTGVASEPLASAGQSCFMNPRSTVPHRDGADEVGQYWRGGAGEEGDRGRCVLAVFGISTSLSFLGAAGCDPGSWQCLGSEGLSRNRSAGRRRYRTELNMYALQSLTVVSAALFRVSRSPTVSGRARSRPIVVHGRAIPPSADRYPRRS